MQSLLEYLKAAPKTYLIKTHRRENPNEGLLQATQVVGSVFAWACASSRTTKILGSLNALELHILALVYCSENRGLAESELLASMDRKFQTPLLNALAKLEYELLIFTHKGGATSFHGFSEFVENILAFTFEKSIKTAGATPHWISHNNFLLSHVCHFLGQAALGGMKITQNGDMHRKDKNALAAHFTSSEKLSVSIPSDEAQFITQCAIDKGWILEDAGDIWLCDVGRNFVKQDRYSAFREILSWWQEQRILGIKEVLKAWQQLDSSEPKAYTIDSWAQLLWVYAGQKKKKISEDSTGCTWETLPRTLQELWLLGIVDFGLDKGKILSVRLVPKSASLLERNTNDSDSQKNMAPISLANLESLVPIQTDLEKQFYLELVGHRANDEMMVKYHFNKQSVVHGLQSGFPMQTFEALLTWLRYEPAATRTLMEWASSYASAIFLDTIVLKVSDPKRLHELLEIPQLQELMQEYIPNYGFILAKSAKAQVRELLHQFGLMPGDSQAQRPELKPILNTDIDSIWAKPNFNLADPQYWEGLPQRVPISASAIEKNSAAPVEQGNPEKIKLIEKAIKLGKKIEFTFPLGQSKRIFVSPLGVIKHKEPFKLIGTEQGSGHRNEYLLDEIKALKSAE